MQASIAEAAPDVFLDRVETSLMGDQPITKLFADTGENLFSSSPHTGLLWALESLAWDPALLGRAALTLAKLSRLDSGGKLLNRLHKSLIEIFVPSHPQTNASLEQRLRVIDMLAQREPEVTWRLLCELLSHEVVTNTARPQQSRYYFTTAFVEFSNRYDRWIVRGPLAPGSSAKTEGVGVTSFSCCRLCRWINMKRL